MAISYKMLARHVRQVLGNEPASEVSPINIIDLAQEWLVGMRQWRFLQNAEAYLTLRAQVDFSGAVWDEDDLTLTENGAFADFDLLTEDTVEITSGTGVDLRNVQITAATDDAITLAESIKATAAVDVAGSIKCRRVALPLDFRNAVSISSTNDGVHTVNWVTPALLNMLRGHGITSEAAGSWKVALEYVGTPPRPVLGVYPTPVEGAVDALRMIYMRGPLRGAYTDPDTTILDWPEYIEPLLVETVRAYALGMEPSKNQNLAALLSVVRAGPLWESARSADDRMQDKYGVVRNGAAQRRRRYGERWLNSVPGGPS